MHARDGGSEEKGAEHALPPRVFPLRTELEEGGEGDGGGDASDDDRDGDEDGAVADGVVGLERGRVVHETDDEAGEDTTDGCADKAERDGGVDNEEGGVEGNDGHKERENGEARVDLDVPVDASDGTKAHVHADEVHSPDTDGSHGGSSKGEKKDVLPALVGGTFAEKEEG